MKRIKVIVDTNGNIQLQTEGFSGQSCIDATKSLELALGKLQAMERTPEYFDKDGKPRDAYIHKVN